jgi:hypothetical protein
MKRLPALTSFERRVDVSLQLIPGIKGQRSIDSRLGGDNLTVALYLFYFDASGKRKRSLSFLLPLVLFQSVRSFTHDVRGSPIFAS